jgi:hypothetical protein
MLITPKKQGKSKNHPDFSKKPSQYFQMKLELGNGG